MISRFLCVSMCSAVSLLLTTNVHSAGTDGYFQEQQDGWFWYEEPPVEEEPTQDEEATVPAPPDAVNQPKQDPHSGPQVGSVAWLREAMPIALDVATDNPSPENVERYFLLQRIAMDKAEKFADVSQMVTTGHPILDEGRRRPRQDTFAKKLEEIAEQHERVVLKDLFQTSALLLFIDKSCSGCGLVSENLYRMAQSHGLVWRVVSLDGAILPERMNAKHSFDVSLAEKLGVAEGGAVFLATPPNSFVPVTWNPTGGAEISERILLVARRAGLISEEQYQSTTPINPMIDAADPIVIQEVPEILKSADRLLQSQSETTLGRNE